MERKVGLAFLGLGFAIAFVALAYLPAASAAPSPQDWDPSKTYDETFNNFTTALNVTANVGVPMAYFANCSQNDFDFMYVWLAGGQDLTFTITFDPAAGQTRFDAHIWSPEHFELVHLTPVGPQFAFNFNLSTTTRQAGPYYFSTNRCNFIDELYNLTWTSSATASASDGNNQLSQATA